MQNVFPPRQGLYRPEFAEALKRALPILWDGVPYSNTRDNVWICSCLADSESETTAKGMSASLTNLIAARLHPHASLTAYTIAELNKNSETEFYSLCREEAQANRQAWMLDMIEEFSTETVSDLPDTV
jgi:hypothetical protein